MKSLNLEQMEKVQGGKFWGTQQEVDCSLALLTNTCKVCDVTYYFWIAAYSTGCEFIPV
jgi:hypothetical protein